MNDGEVRDHYIIGDKLGKGSFGEVRKATHIVTGEERAIKFIDKAMLSRNEMKALIVEVSLLAEMDHPNIVKINDFYDEKFTFVLVTEIVRGGELFKKVAKKALKENEV
jgi:serine/threonine protein kinase